MEKPAGPHEVIITYDGKLASDTTEAGELINSSGHVQELKRNFNLLSCIALGVVLGNVWPAAGGSILASIFNGGPPGVLYEFLTVSFFYCLIALCIAELASAIPSSGGVYHWASVTPGRKYGRIVGYFAGVWNWLGWVLGAASMASIFGNAVVQMYALMHPDFVPHAWHVFVAYIGITWVVCLTVCFGNKMLPYLNNVALCLVLVGWLITMTTVLAMPGHGGRPPLASSSFVFTDWSANIGYPDGFVFIAGMLNGAYAIGVPDAVTHIAEEVPYPSKNLPVAIAAQMVIGIMTGFVYLIAILYAINDYNALLSSSFPLAEIYLQATGSPAGAVGLLVIFMLTIVFTQVGTFIAGGRQLWALGRDRATPVPKFLGQINSRLGMPFNATIICGILVTALGCIYLGSTTAFNAFISAFVLLSSSSYCAAILPNLLTGRKNIKYGSFELKGWIGFACSFISCAYIIVWFVIYSFPVALPVNAQSMNYACLIWGGLSIFAAIWWFAGARRNYVGPQTTGGIVTRAEMVKKGETLDT